MLLTGKLQKVEKCIEIIVKLAFKHDEQSVRILIPGNYVSKLIGAKGCLIRDISNKSGGAQISILSDKKLERSIHEIMVEVSGDTKSCTNATLMVIEQIELFKQGGPILQTGKVINRNMVEQFENSVFANKSKMMQITHVTNNNKFQKRSKSKKSGKRKRWSSMSSKSSASSKKYHSRRKRAKRYCNSSSRSNSGNFNGSNHTESSRKRSKSKDSNKSRNSQNLERNKESKNSQNKSPPSVGRIDP